jgi:hypothetical protein
MYSDARSQSLSVGEALLRRWRELGPDVGVLVELGASEAERRPLIALNEHRVLEMGSVFKVFLLAAFARAVERGEAIWEQPFRIAASDRLPHSAVLEDLPDGREISARDLLIAMMGQSDNTATQMVIDWLPDGAVDDVIRAAGLESTVVDSDLRGLYARAEADPGFEPNVCRTTAADMVRFYRFALWGGLLNDLLVSATFRDILESENRDQGTTWTGLTCLRKSGYVAPPPLLGVGFVGAMLGGTEPLVFAFALNRHIDQAHGELLSAAFGPVIHDTLVWAIANAGALSR